VGTLIGAGHLHLTVLCGNPKAGSRTLHIAEALVAQLLAHGSYVTAIPLMTGGDLTHALGPEVSMAKLDEKIAAWVTTNVAALRHVAALAPHTASSVEDAAVRP
jgi:hypothetical protein